MIVWEYDVWKEVALEKLVEREMFEKKDCGWVMEENKDQKLWFGSTFKKESYDLGTV